jgi:hypothetical protein
MEYKKKRNHQSLFIKLPLLECNKITNWKHFLIYSQTSYDRTRKRWTFNTGDCLIEVTAWTGLTVIIEMRRQCLFKRHQIILEYFWYSIFIVYIYIYMYIELESLLFVIKSFVSKVEANVMCYLVSTDIISKWQKIAVPGCNRLIFKAILAKNVCF